MMMSASGQSERANWRVAPWLNDFRGIWWTPKPKSLKFSTELSSDEESIANSISSLKVWLAKDLNKLLDESLALRVGITRTNIRSQPRVKLSM